MVDAEYGGCGCSLQERRKGKKVERRLKIKKILFERLNVVTKKKNAHKRKNF